MNAPVNIRILLAASVIVFGMMEWSACTTSLGEPEFDNPFDPRNPDYIIPETTIHQGPSEGATLDTHSVTFAWSGNEQVVEYRYSLTGLGWSEWTDDTSASYSYLEEGQYTFEVQGRYISDDEDDTPDTVNFEIDDIHGPALRFFPRYLVAAFKDTIALEVVLEEVDDLKGVRAELEFDPTRLQINRLLVLDDTTSLLLQNGGEVISFVAFDNASGTATIEVATATGNPPAVSGTGVIAKVIFTIVQPGSTQVAFTAESELRDGGNQTIVLQESVPAVVEVLP